MGTNDSSISPLVRLLISCHLHSQLEFFCHLKMFPCLECLSGHVVSWKLCVIIQMMPPGCGDAASPSRAKIESTLSTVLHCSTGIPNFVWVHHFSFSCHCFAHSAIYMSVTFGIDYESILCFRKVNIKVRIGFLQGITVYSACSGSTLDPDVGWFIESCSDLVEIFTDVLKLFHLVTYICKQLGLLEGFIVNIVVILVKQ